jgi:hypothetical protein
LQISKIEKVVPIHQSWNFKLISKRLLRLHDHGLMRIFKLNVVTPGQDFNKSMFFESLISTPFYQELFFDHYSQISKGRHGPFLIQNINAKSFSEQLKDFFLEDFIQVLSSPKWGCPPIKKDSLNKVKNILPVIVNQDSFIYFLDKCRSFNNLSNEANIYEHEWSHNLTSFYEYVIFNKESHTAYLIILTYE